MYIQQHEDEALLSYGHDIETGIMSAMGYAHPKPSLLPHFGSPLFGLGMSGYGWGLDKGNVGR